MQVDGPRNLRGARKLIGEIPLFKGVHRQSTSIFWEGFKCEHTYWDSKDGELCLSRVKLEETLVEAHNDTNMQIVHLTWV